MMVHNTKSSHPSWGFGSESTESTNAGSLQVCCLASLSTSFWVLSDRGFGYVQEVEMYSVPHGLGLRHWACMKDPVSA